MKKRFIFSVLLATSISFLSTSHSVNASTKLLKVNHSTNLYSSAGKKTTARLTKAITTTYTKSKYFKLGKEKSLLYYLPKYKKWILADKVSLVKSTKKYQQAKIVLPKNYTRKNLLQAFTQTPSIRFKKACLEGMDKNDFSRIANLAENKRDDQIKINLNKLTTKQKRELADFTLKLINQSRKQLDLPAWKYSPSAQKLADDIAHQYQVHGKSISDQKGHYIQGITTATKANGFTGPLIQDNYVENMGGFLANKTMTMTQAKKKIYFILKQMIFGFAGNTENQRKDQSKYLEWQHAASIFNTQGSKHDSDWDYFGLSVSRKGKAYTIHFICIPSFMVKEYHQGTWK